MSQLTEARLHTANRLCDLFHASRPDEDYNAHLRIALIAVDAIAEYAAKLAVQSMIQVMTKNVADSHKSADGPNPTSPS